MDKSFWWVSHGTSFREELAAGYIWCPQVTATDIQRPTWLNVSKVRKGDVIFSYAQQSIKAIGVAQSNCYEANVPAGHRSWSGKGWQVEIDWVELENNFKPKQYIEQLLPLLPEKNSPLRIRSDVPSEIGNGTQVYLCAISPALAALLYELADQDDPGLIAEVARVEIDSEKVNKTEKEALVKSRIGQGRFRANLLEIEPKCRVTKVSDTRFLIASHIKPWAVSSNKERLDPNNGLMLAPHIDALFDRGLISFTVEGNMLVKDSVVESILSSWGVDAAANFGRFTAQQEDYLSYHRSRLFEPK